MSSYNLKQAGHSIPNPKQCERCGVGPAVYNCIECNFKICDVCAVSLGPGSKGVCLSCG